MKGLSQAAQKALGDTRTLTLYTQALGQPRRVYKKRTLSQEKATNSKTYNPHGQNTV